MRIAIISSFVKTSPFPDFLADGVDEVGLPQSGVSVNKQGVIAVGGVGGNRPAGGVGKLVVGPHNEGIKGIGVLPRFLLFLLLGGGSLGSRSAVPRAKELYLHLKAHHRGKGVLQEGKILFLQDVLFKFGGDVKRGHRAVKGSGLNVPNPKIVGDLGEVLLAVLTSELEQVLEGIHGIIHTPLG